MRFALILVLVLLARLSFAQSNAAPSNPSPPASKPTSSVKLSKSAMTAAELQKAVDQLTQSNRDLLDLLKKQQGVLEDMQFDRRLQSRQIQSLEERLEDTLFENTKLQKQVATLEADAAVHPIALAQPAKTTDAQAGTANAVPGAVTNAPPAPAPPPVAEEPAPPPATYLPRARHGRHAGNEIVAPAFHTQGR